VENEYFIFNPGTNTARAPLPVNFKHLLGFAAQLTQFLNIHNQAQLTNVNQLLSQTLNLQVSNMIQRVIAQVIGEYGEGFVTIKGTEGGALHVSVQDMPSTAKTIKRAAISESTIANNEIVAAVVGKQLCIVNLMFTVAGESDIYLNSDANHMSGPLDFGATSEPRGFVSNHGDFPLKTISGEGFFIESDSTEQISGYVTYYEE